MSRRLVRTVLVPLLVAVALFVVPLALVSVRDARLQLIELAERRAATAALLASTADRPALLHEHMLGLPAIEGERLAVLDSHGRIVADTGEGSLTVPQAVGERALAGRINGSFEPDRQQVVAAAPVVRDGSVEGLSVVTLPADAVMTRSRALLATLGLSALGLVLVAGYAARAVARSVVRPVEQLDETAVRLAQGDLTARAPTDRGPPEVQRLAATLNTTAERLQDLLAAQRAFVADASHQLRTPLTGLKLRVEAMQLGGATPKAVDAVSTELDRLTRLVEQLLALARAEGRQPKPVAVHVADVVADRVDSWQAVADQKDVTLRTHIAADLPDAQAVDGALEQILDNYLSNALRAAPPGSTVDIEVGADGDRVFCSVADRGPGLTEDQRRHAFERFWQAPDAPRDGTYGLGLAIVARLADASDARVALRNRDAGGLVAKVALRPASVPAPPAQRPTA